MLITYFKDPRILARYRSGLASIYLEDFITWLESQGYRRFMIRRHVRGVVHFRDWAEAEGLAVRRFRSRRAQSPLQPTGGTQFLAVPKRQSEVFLSECLFIVDFLEEVGAVEPYPARGVDSRSSASVGVQRVDADAARYIGYYA